MLTRNREGAAEEVINRVWTAQYGVACRGVNWERHGLDELLTVVACVGARPLAAICRLLAEDYSGWSGALHDHIMIICIYVLTRRRHLLMLQSPHHTLRSCPTVVSTGVIDSTHH